VDHTGSPLSAASLELPAEPRDETMMRKIEEDEEEEEKVMAEDVMGEVWR